MKPVSPSANLILLIAIGIFSSSSVNCESEGKYFTDIGVMKKGVISKHCLSQKNIYSFIIRTNILPMLLFLDNKMPS